VQDESEKIVEVRVNSVKVRLRVRLRSLCLELAVEVK